MNLSFFDTVNEFLEDAQEYSQQHQPTALHKNMDSLNSELRALSNRMRQNGVMMYIDSLKETQITDCSICYENISRGVKLDCKHGFCMSCIKKWLEIGEFCPLCKEPIVFPRLTGSTKTLDKKENDENDSFR